MKDYYMFKGKKRFYYPAHEVRTYKPGTVCILPDIGTTKFTSQNVGGCKVEVISAYYTINSPFKNYGRVVKVLTGKKAGKTLRIQT